MKIYESAEELIGRTPLVRLSRFEKKYGVSAKIMAKVESFNPAGSVKDRAARNMLDDAEARGLISPGATIIEPTSGNTGIGLCSVAAIRGYKTVIVMPDSMSEERRTLMRAYGAELVLTDGALGMAGAIKTAEELHAKTPNSFIPAQFENYANAEAHIKTTGPEIYDDTDGEVDFFVAGVGTGGTLTGIGKYLKKCINGVKIVAVEPLSSNLLTGGRAGAHKIQGIGANFVPSLLDRSVIDEVVDVSDADAIATARDFGKCEGFLCGISSGAALSAAIELGKRKENEGKTIVVLLPDSGDRYLSTELYKV